MPAEVGSSTCRKRGKIFAPPLALTTCARFLRQTDRQPIEGRGGGAGERVSKLLFLLLHNCGAQAWTTTGRESGCCPVRSKYSRSYYWFLKHFSETKYDTHARIGKYYPPNIFPYTVVVVKIGAT